MGHITERLRKVAWAILFVGERALDASGLITAAWSWFLWALVVVLLLWAIWPFLRAFPRSHRLTFLWGQRILAGASLIGVGVLLGTSFDGIPDESSDEPTNYSGPIDLTAPVARDSAFRDDLRFFIDAYAMPAYLPSEQLLRQVAETEPDELIKRLLNNQVAGESARRRGAVRDAFDDPSAADDEIRDAVCEVFTMYLDLVSWTYWIGTKNGFDFDSDEYEEWLRRDRAFEDNYIVFRADPKFQGFCRVSFESGSRVQ